MGKKFVQRKGRNLNFTINEMLDSVRWRIAIQNFNQDRSFMEALLTEFGLECLTVAKNKVIKTYNMNSGLAQFEMAPLLRNIGVEEYDTFNIYFSLSEAEQALYLGDIKGTLTEEKRTELLDRVRKQFMGS